MGRPSCQLGISTALVAQKSIVSNFLLGILGNGYDLTPWGEWAEDLEVNKVKFSRSPFKCYFTEVTPPP